MRLFLAVAVLMLAFVAYTEAQEEADQSSFSKFTERLGQLGRQVAGGFVSAYETARDSETVAKSTNWIRDHFQRMKDKINE